MNTAIAIEVTADGKIDFSFRGAPNLIPMLIGAMEMVKTGLIKRAENDFGSMKWEDPKPSLLQKEYSTYSEPSEVEVTRDIALAAYYQAMQKLRDRLHAIGQSSKTATFLIDPSLLQL